MNRRRWSCLLVLLAACGSGDDVADGGDAAVGDGHTPTGQYAACGGRIFDPSTGAIDAAEYARVASAWDPAAIDCRLGPDWAAFHPGVTDDPRDTVWEAPGTVVPPAPAYRNNQGYTYQLGGPPVMSTNIFGSEDGQVLYAPMLATDHGIDRISVYDWSYNCIIEMPEPVWWGGTHPDPSVNQAPWIAAFGGPLTQPIATARTVASWANDALVIFEPSFIGATGTQTSDDHFPFFQFPPNKIPTAIATTNGSEFAFVTVWDTATQHGQIAVFALEALGLPFHSWLYIGLVNAGSYTSMKLLGYVDLPTMATPTHISVGTNNAKHTLYGLTTVQGTVDSTVKLDDQATRDDFYSGRDADQIASAGFAVVSSRIEGRVVFVDLRPLVSYYRDMYLTTPEKFAQTKLRGPGPTDWPPTFDTYPAQVPVVVTSIDTPSPTAVLAGELASWSEKRKAFVAHLDGSIDMYEIGGLGDATAATAAAIKVTTTVQVGRNPTQMFFIRHAEPTLPHTSPYEFNDTFVAVSRGDRELDWVTSTPTTANIYRKLRDTRMNDPVAVHVAGDAYIVTVADFAGHQVINYRVGATPAQDSPEKTSFGAGPDGKADLECGGTMMFPGAPFSVSFTNVN